MEDQRVKDVEIWMPPSIQTQTNTTMGMSVFQKIFCHLCLDLYLICFFTMLLFSFSVKCIAHALHKFSMVYITVCFLKKKTLKGQSHGYFKIIAYTNYNISFSGDPVSCSVQCVHMMAWWGFWIRWREFVMWGLNQGEKNQLDLN